MSLVKQQLSDVKQQPKIRYDMLQSNDPVASSLDTQADTLNSNSDTSSSDAKRPLVMLRTKRKLKHELECTADILNSTALSTRHLSIDDLKPWYDEEQLSELIDLGGNPAPTLSDIRYEDAFNEFLEECQGNNRRHIWTAAEDDFVKRNYKHLSDNTIALALNIPSQQIINRRMTLKLEKGQRTSEYEIPIIVWADRKEFDLDCVKFRLTKVREAYVDK